MVNKQEDITFVDGFCGIGGIRLGLERSDPRYKCVWANDNDPRACKIYWGRFDNDRLDWRDFTRIDKQTIPDHRLFCAGFPCQSFSIAGQRRGFKDTRGTLFFEICELLRVKRTPYVFLENVKGLLSHDDGRTFGVILSSLDELGYDCQWQVLNSKDFGVPQNRERVFIVGHLRGIRRPKVFPLRESSQGLNGPQGENGKVGLWIRSKDNSIASALRVGGSGLESNLISSTISSRYNKDGSDQLICLADGGQVYRVYDPTGLSPTIPTTSEGLHIPKIPSKTTVRQLTPLECERLQGFPDNWTKVQGVTDDERYHTLGNAVTVSVIKAIGVELAQQV